MSMMNCSAAIQAVLDRASSHMDNLIVIRVDSRADTPPASLSRRLTLPLSADAQLAFALGCAQAGLQGLADELRAALAAWEAGGGEDHLRTGQAELVLKQLEAKSEELRAVRERMKTLIAQADSAEAGARQAELFQALAQFRRFGREETQ